MSSDLAEKKKALLAALLKERQAARAAIASIPRRENRARAELSFEQERLLFLDQLEPGRATYNVAQAMRLRGPIEVAALRAALDRLVARHEPMRMSFVDDGVAPYANVAEHVTVPIEIEAPPGPVDEALIATFVKTLVEKPIALDRAPPMRVGLLRVADDDHVLVLVVHHIATDGWSMRTLSRELVVGYEAARRGEDPAFPSLQIGYGDYAAWQRARVAAGAFEPMLAFWKRELDGTEPLELPTDRPRPARSSERGERIVRDLPKHVLAGARALAAKHDATTYMVFLSALYATLGRYTSQRRISVGSPVANRPTPALEPLVGFFVNTVVLRGDLHGRPTGHELVKRTRATVLNAFANEAVPFSRVVTAVGIERSLTQQPLFQVMLVHQRVLPDAQAPQLSPGLTIEELPSETGTSKFDLLLNIAESDEEASVVIELATDLFELSTGQRLFTHFFRTLEALVEAPERALDELPLLDDDERRAELQRWVGAAHPLATGSLASGFEATRARTPDAIAIVHGPTKLTYAELDERANRLANLLVAQGAGPDRTVAIMVTRGPALAVAVLAVLKAGAAYLPLDPAYPDERLAFMLADARPRVVLSDAANVARLGRDAILLDDLEALIADQPSKRPDVRVAPHNLGYVIYTSGSTGRPKGVALGVGALHNLIDWHLAETRIPAATTLQLASLSFDASFHELFAAWTGGGKVVLIDEETRRDPTLLGAVIDREHVEKVIVPVVMLQRLCEEFPTGLRSLVEVYATGEQLQVTDAVRRFFAGHAACDLWNHYGPSETHVVTGWKLQGPPSDWPTYPPIGLPIWNTQMYVLDERMGLVPPGVIGDVYIGGDMLARGYLGRPDLTADRFVPSPFAPGARLYRTGDRGRRHATNTIEFLGRGDDQLKIRGYRVELGEVEAALLGVPGVREAAVLAHDGALGKRLVGYVVATPPDDEILRVLRERLPDWMIPSALVRLERLPLNANGKIDRRALPAPTVVERAYEPPRTTTERTLAAIWQDALAVDRVGRDDDFFALGGHSLVATRVMRATRRAFRVSLPLRALFESPRLHALARVIDEQPVDDNELPPLLPRAEGESAVSLHQRKLYDFYAQGGQLSLLPMFLDLSGSLDIDALKRTLAIVVGRHESLRSRFERGEDGPTSLIVDDTSSPFKVIDLSSLPDDERRNKTIELVHARISTTMPLHEHVLETLVVKQSAERHVITIVISHLVSDAHSLDILRAEIMETYRLVASGAEASSEGPIVCYGDWAAWHRRIQSSPAVRRQAEYWRKRLAGVQAFAPPIREPALDEPRVAAFTLPVALGQTLLQIEQAGTASPLHVIATAFFAALHRTFGDRDLLANSSFGNRVEPGTDCIVGLMLTPMFLRVQIDPDATFATTLERLHRDLIEDRANSELYLATEFPAEHEVCQINIGYSQGRRIDLPQTAELALNDPSWIVPPVQTISFFRWGLWVAQSEAQFQVQLRWQPEFVSPPQAVAVRERLLGALQLLAESPDRVISSL